jgi:hypothetical protein
LQPSASQQHMSGVAARHHSVQLTPGARGGARVERGGCRVCVRQRHTRQMGRHTGVQMHAASSTCRVVQRGTTRSSPDLLEVAGRGGTHRDTITFHSATATCVPT